jgi:curved DNA-binding protein CbpA
MTTTAEFVNYYEILSVAETADADAIQKAIRDQRRTWNKRAGQSDPIKRAQAEERIRQLAEAERVLLDPTSRAKFDQASKVYRPPSAPTSTSDGATRDWLLEARSYFAKGNAPSAYYAAREAIALNGARHEAWSIRANSSFLMNNFRDAEFEFNEAIRLQPNNPDYHFDLAEAYASADQWRSALGEYETALRLAPGNPVYRTAIANVYIQNEIPDRALEIMEGVVKEFPDTEVFQYYLALALHDVNLTKWSRLRDGSWSLTSEAQIDITRRMSGRALGLKYDDQRLRASLQENLDLADAAAEDAWYHGDFGPYMFAVLVGICALAAYGLGVLIIGAAVWVYVATHRMPRWKHNAKSPFIAQRGI